MQTILAWVMVVGIIATAYPATGSLLMWSSEPRGKALQAAVALGLSVGALTLIMLWEALLGLGWSVLGIMLPYLGAMAAMWWVGKEKVRKMDMKNHVPTENSYGLFDKLVIGVCAVIAAAVVFNAVYWPFHKDDVIGIYGKYGRLMAETGTLVPFQGRDDAFYQAYPIEIPLVYTYTYLASGWENQYLAGLVPALMSIGCLLAVYVLGKTVYGERAGLLAALLLAITPSFARWGSSGYVDLPMAFYYTLAAVFLWRLWKSDETGDALLAGGAAGLAAWTKNAGLMGIVFVGMWLGFGYLRSKIRLQNVLTVVAVCGIIAAPWYIRNYVEARLIVPPTAWTEQAERTISNLLAFITEPENFALTGWVVMISGVWAVFKLLKRDNDDKIKTLFLGLLTVPFFGVWWLLVSYDPRFLLLFFPILVVMGGAWLAHILESLPHQWQRSGLWATAIVAVIMACYILWISVEFKEAILRNPFMGDAEKQVIVSEK